MKHFWELPDARGRRFCSFDFGIGEAAAVGAAGAEGGALAGPFAGSSAIAAAGGGGAAATGGTGLLPWLQGASALTSLLGIAGSTRAGVNAASGQATLAEMEAAQARQAAQFNATQYARGARIQIAKGVATAAASGLDIASGSPLLNELENVKQAEIQKQNILRTGQLQGDALDYQARLARAGISGIYTQGLAQGGSVLSSWMYNRQLQNLRLTGNA